MINIMLLRSWKTYSGSQTFVYHLARALKAVGESVQIIRVNHWKKRGYKESKLFKHSPTEVIDIDEGSILWYAKKHPSIIAFLNNEFSDIGCQLMEKFNIPIVIHDRRGYTAYQDEIVRIQPRIACIRKSVREISEQDGLKNTRFIPHPYGKALANDFEEVNTPPAWAHCLSRIGGEKNIDMLVEANKVLPAKKQILALGEDDDRFARMKLHKIEPEWETILGRKLHGKRFSSGYLAAKNAGYAIDLSVLNKNGKGGSQYTFLEAMDAGTPLIIHRDWIIPFDEMVEGYNCLAVKTVPELVDILETEPQYWTLQRGYRETLKKHDYAVTGKQYLDFIRGE